MSWVGDLVARFMAQAEHAPSSEVAGVSMRKRLNVYTIVVRGPIEPKSEKAARNSLRIRPNAKSRIPARPDDPEAMKTACALHLLDLKRERAACL